MQANGSRKAEGGRRTLVFLSQHTIRTVSERHSGPVSTEKTEETAHLVLMTANPGAFPDVRGLSRFQKYS
jgi:hypothetical protein